MGHTVLRGQHLQPTDCQPARARRTLVDSVHLGRPLEHVRVSQQRDTTLLGED